jgi:hypothetical protein
MRTTYESDDGQYFETKADCIEYERLLPILHSLLESTETIELGELEAKKFLRDLKAHLQPSCLERYLFDHRKEFATIAELLKPVTEEG